MPCADMYAAVLKLVSAYCAATSLSEECAVSKHLCKICIDICIDFWRFLTSQGLDR